MLLNWGYFWLPWDPGQCLETFIVMTRHCYWLLEGRSRGCRRAQPPLPVNYLTDSAEAESQAAEGRDRLLPRTGVQVLKDKVSMQSSRFRYRE